MFCLKLGYTTNLIWIETIIGYDHQVSDRTCIYYIILLLLLLLLLLLPFLLFISIIIIFIIVIFIVIIILYIIYYYHIVGDSVHHELSRCYRLVSIWSGWIPPVDVPKKSLQLFTESYGGFFRKWG